MSGPRPGSGGAFAFWSSSGNIGGEKVLREKVRCLQQKVRQVVPLPSILSLFPPSRFLPPRSQPFCFFLQVTGLLSWSLHGLVQLFAPACKGRQELGLLRPSPVVVTTKLPQENQRSRSPPSLSALLPLPVRVPRPHRPGLRRGCSGIRLEGPRPPAPGKCSSSKCSATRCPSLCLCLCACLVVTGRAFDASASGSGRSARGRRGRALLKAVLLFSLLRRRL